MKVLLTGAAGFIGMHVCERLLERGDEVVGIDDLNAYYDPSLKRARLARLTPHVNFRFHRLSVEDGSGLEGLFRLEEADRIVHLAAQVGVRYSLKDPQAFAGANLQGFVNILECSRRYRVQHLVYASSSSVYGGHTQMPFGERHSVDHPISLYAATKKANELMAHAYSHLFVLPTTGLRFFTVYGPWGRPDMAPMLFVRAICESRSIDVFNQGKLLRDFTYIDDIVEGIVRVLDKPAIPNPAFDPSNPDPATSHAPYRIFNIGNGQPMPLMDFVGALEEALGKQAEKNYLPMQPGDVLATSADTSALEAWVGFRPRTPVSEGVTRLVNWYRGYYDR